MLSPLSALSVLSVLSVLSTTQPCSVSRLLPAYAHNDYRNQHPLEDALALGYQGVEADYVLVDGELLVAHGRAEAIRHRSLERLYLAPLRGRVLRCGWVQTADRPFLLTIEYKERRLEGYRTLRELLTRYADVVGTAKAPGPPDCFGAAHPRNDSSNLFLGRPSARPPVRLYVQIVHVLRIALDELPARLDLVAHQLVK